jgi:hypothetical protein
MESLGREQLAFSKQQYAEMKPLAERVFGQQMAAQQQQMDQAQDYFNYQQQTFRPVERGLVRDAEAYSTEGNRERLAQDAALQTARAFDQTQAMGDRAAAARGISVDSPAAMAMRNRGQYALAAQRAGAMTGARNQAEQTGWARRMDVTGLGRGLAGASTAAYQGATGAGSAGMASAMAPGSQYQQGMAGAGTTMGNIATGQAGLYNAAQNRNAEITGALIGAGTTAAVKYSDRRLKQNIELVGRDERTMLPLYEFEYIGGSGKRYLGVMADDVEARFPDMVYEMPDGYKAVNYAGLGIEMVGV